MQIPATAIEIDVEIGYHDDFAGADDIRHVRIDFVIVIAVFHRHHRRPGLYQVGETHLHHLLDNPEFGTGEITALDLGMNAAVTAEEVVYQDENQLRIQHDQPGAAQRRHFDHAQGGGNEQRMDVLGKLDHLDAVDRDFR